MDMESGVYSLPEHMATPAVSLCRSAAKTRRGEPPHVTPRPVRAVYGLAGSRRIGSFFVVALTPMSVTSSQRSRAPNLRTQ